MASSDFTVNGSSLPQAISAAWGATITCALVSTQGVNTVAWSVLGKSRSTLSTLTLTPSGSPSGSTMTFDLPDADSEVAAGAAYLIQCTISYSVAGKPRTHTTRAVIGVETNGRVPAALGETTERGTYGWLELLNYAISTGYMIDDTSADVAVTGGAGATTLHDYELADVATDGQTIEVDIRIETWEGADNTNVATIHATAYILVDSGGSTILNSPSTEQTVLGTLEAGVSFAWAITANTILRTTCTSTVTDMRCSVKAAHLPARTRSETP